MNETNDIYLNVDDRSERLICRLLDGEITAREQGELDAILERDDAARSLLEDYRRIDALSASALGSRSAGTKTAVSDRKPHGLWLAAAGAVLAAAAVILFSLAPSFWRSPSNATNFAQVVPRPATTLPRTTGYPAGPQWVDYRGGVDYVPAQRSRLLNRDLIGVPDKKKNVIYLYEVDTQSTSIVPVANEF
jgi:anti-sigma factor RsiW